VLRIPEQAVVPTANQAVLPRKNILLCAPGEHHEMKRIAATFIALVASALFAAAQPAKEPYASGLGEFMTATQLRHAKLWFAGKENNWDLAAYEIDEITEGLEAVSDP
jgi:hypothetical protein